MSNRKNSTSFCPSSEWIETELSEVVPNVQYGISSSLDDRGGVPVLRMNNLNDGSIDVSDLKYSTSSEAKSLLLHQNDVLFNRTNSLEHVGRTSLWRCELSKASFASYLVRLNPDVTRLDPEFLVRWLNLSQSQLAIRRFATPGVHQVNINPTNLRKTRIRFPERLSEQRKIARVLRNMDKLIEKTEALIAKYQSVKQGMMQDLFTRGVDEHGHLRPRYEDAPELYKESELGWIPKEWSIRPVTNVTEGGPKNGYFKKPELVGSGYKLVNVTDLYQDYGIDTDHPAIERVEASEGDFQKHGITEGDLFITRSSLVLTGIAHCNIVRQVKEPTLFECHVMRLRPNKQAVDPDFLAFYMQTSKARLHFMARAKQVAMTTISQPDIASLPVSLPPLSEQRKISQSIIAVEEAWRREAVVSKKLRLRKTGLMQDLLTGKVRVNPVDEEEAS